MGLYKCDSVKDLERWRLSWVIKVSSKCNHVCHKREEEGDLTQTREGNEKMVKKWWGHRGRNASRAHKLSDCGAGEKRLWVPWTARRSNQPILKEINTEYLLEGLKLQYFGHLMQRADSLEKTLMLMLGKIEGSRRRRGQQRMRWLDAIIDSMDMSLSKPGK